MQLVIGDSEIHPQTVNMTANVSQTKEQLKNLASAVTKNFFSVVLNYKNANGVECSSSPVQMSADSGSGGLIYLISVNTRFYTDIKIN